MNALLLEFLRRENIAYTIGEDLSKKSYVKIGVLADTVYPKCREQLVSLLVFLSKEKIRYKLLGAMTNILFCAGSAECLFVSTEKVKGVTVDGIVVSAMCGERFSSLVLSAAKIGLSLSPSLFGIPGSVGGMLYSNAGAYGAEISDSLANAEILDINSGRIYNFTKNDMNFSYRGSALQYGNYAVISASFLACRQNSADVLLRIREVMNKRRAAQPIGIPSLGSVFKRPANDYAARLIDASGLKGVRVGDAAVSNKHAGFIVNLGRASADDFTALIAIIRDRVYSLYGVLLEEEIEILR